MTEKEKEDLKRGGEGEEVAAVQRCDREVRKERVRKYVSHMSQQHVAGSQGASLAGCCMADDDRLSC